MQAISAAIALAVAALCGLAGWYFGTDHVQAAWDKAERERAELVAADLREQSAAGRRVSVAYQSDRAARERRVWSLKPEFTDVLNQPAPNCPSVARAGDIVLPGRLGRLLNAVADDSAEAAAPR